MREKDETLSKKEPVSKAVIIAWTFIAILFSGLVFFALYEIYLHNSTLPFIYSLLLLAGLVFEYKTICERWDKVIITASVALACSFISFLPVNEIGVENSLRIWPFVICVVFGIATMVSYGEKSSIKLTEGITFMQCLALIYWLIDRLTDSNLNKTSYVIIGLVLICSSFAAFHAFSYTELTKKTRFFLSFWSAAIMTFFASLNVYAVYQMQREAAGSEVIVAMFQHLFLGISSVYIIQNIYLIAGYFPLEDWKELKHYKKNRRKLTTIHISRFSDKQVILKQVAICFFICTLLFSINYFIDIVPANLAIWIAFLIVPLTLEIIERRGMKQTDGNNVRTSPSH